MIVSGSSNPDVGVQDDALRDPPYVNDQAVVGIAGKRGRDNSGLQAALFITGASPWAINVFAAMPYVAPPHLPPTSYLGDAGVASA